MRLVFLALALMACGWLPPAAQAAEGRYVNARFGFSICVPAGLVAQGESENGDGQRFEAADGAALIAYAGHNALDETLAARRDATVERLGPASYRSGGRDWFVVSGRRGETVYYARTALRGDVFSSFELTYPRAAAARWDAAAATLSRCFRAR